MHTGAQPAGDAAFPPTPVNQQNSPALHVVQKLAQADTYVLSRDHRPRRVDRDKVARVLDEEVLVAVGERLCDARRGEDGVESQVAARRRVLEWELEIGVQVVDDRRKDPGGPVPLPVGGMPFFCWFFSGRRRGRRRKRRARRAARRPGRRPSCTQPRLLRSLQTPWRRRHRLWPSSDQRRLHL